MDDTSLSKLLLYNTKKYETDEKELNYPVAATNLAN